MPTSAEAMQQLQQFQQGMLTPEALYGKASNMYGVTQAADTVKGLRGAIQNTTNLLNGVAPSVQGRTANSLVTSAVANRQIQNEQAPISATLDKQGKDYSDANSDYLSLDQKAQAQAQNELTDQNNRLSYLKSIYDTLAGQEAEAAKLAEQKRQFDAQIAESRRAGGGGGSGGGGGALDLASLLGGGGGAAGAPSMSQRQGGGFNFTNADGGAVSAATYAALTKTPFRTVLQNMANKGDNNAKVALAFVGNDFGINKAKVKQAFPGSQKGFDDVIRSLMWK